MKTFYSFLCAVSVLCLVSSCDMDSYIVDWAPVVLDITATDSEGNSIVSPDMPGMSLTYFGKTYTLSDGPYYSSQATKAYLATLYGLVAVPCKTESGDTVYHLCFGEIDGAADIDADIVLNWPDGSHDVIHYHCSDHKEGKNPDCNRWWLLNGKAHDGSSFSFTGKSLE
ncbi:MAG: hypothetical protein K5984_00860 [Bacteroidales bacterium]|nr:hypothetical protein [Bacteroidales bacterium]